MSASRAVVITLVGGILVILVAGWAILQTEAEDTRRLEDFTAQWGPRADYQRLCRAEGPDQAGTVEPTARVAFWTPESVTSPQGRNTIRALSARPPLASGKGDLTHVACVRFVAAIVETCEYDGGFRMPRRRYDAEVTLVEKSSGVSVARWTAEGGAPPECPATISRRPSDPPPSPIEGPEPNFLSGLYELEAFRSRP
jgi:hypothetical protein